MIRLYPKQTTKFIKFSGDNNKIHYDKNFSSNFFFNKPIFHGMNVVLSAFEIFFKNSVKNQYSIDQITIDFKNFCLLSEKLFVKFEKNKIQIVGVMNDKIDIKYNLKKEINKNKINSNLKSLFNFRNLNNPEVLLNCMYLSKIVGTKIPGNGSLILRLIVKNSDSEKSNLNVKKIINNIKEIEFKKSYKTYSVLCGKVKPFNPIKFDIKKNKIIEKKLFKKKILIFGISSELGSATYKLLKKYNCQIKSLSFRLKLENLNLNKKTLFTIKKKISLYNPDYIFYFSSPQIMKITQNIKLVRKLYDSVYIKMPKLIIDYTVKKNKGLNFFLPSSIFLNNIEKYPHLSEYINSKIKMEKVFIKKNTLQLCYWLDCLNLKLNLIIIC